MPAPLSIAPHDKSLDELGRDIVAAASVKGRFALPSDETRSYALDPYMVATRPFLLRRLASAVATLVPPETDRLAGPAPGAVPLVTAVSLCTGLPGAFVGEAARQGSMVDLVDGEVYAGERVVVLDLLPGDGHEAIRAGLALRQLGATVLAVVGGIDLGEGAATASAGAGFRFRSVFDAANLGL